MSHTITDSSPRSPMWVYEENYRLLQHLVPEMESGGDRYCLSGTDGLHALELLVLERWRYTGIIELTKPFLVGDAWLHDLTMHLRLYHDAQVVEVVCYQGCQRIPARYEIEQPSPFAKDEKRQVNQLLHEVLMYCLRNNYREVREPNCSNV